MRLFLYTFILFTISFNAYNQIQPKVVEFNSYQKKETSKNNKNQSLKINPFELFPGEFSIYYEQLIRKNISGEISLGVTFLDHFEFSFTDDDDIEKYTNYNFSTYNRTSKLGYAAGLGLRYYPKGEMNKVYFSAEYKFRKFHTSYEPEYDKKMYEFNVDKSSSILKLTSGYITLFDNGFYFDYNFGLGAMITNRKIESIKYDPVDFKPNITNINSTIIRPKFTFLLKIGYLF